MPNYDDDWMNPPGSVVYIHKEPENKIEYRIMRMRAIPVSGNVGRLHQWKIWSTHDTRVERDKELDHLEREYPAWRLKRSEGNPYYEYHGISMKHQADDYD